MQAVCNYDIIHVHERMTRVHNMFISTRASRTCTGAVMATYNQNRQPESVECLL